MLAWLLAILTTLIEWVTIASLFPVEFLLICLPADGFWGLSAGSFPLPDSTHRQPTCISSSFGSCSIRSSVCNTCDTAFTPDTGGGKSSKVSSKVGFSDKAWRIERNYYFGVAIDFFFSLKIKGAKTPLSAHNTPAFWTAAGAVHSLSSQFDAPPMWCACSGRPIQITKLN